MDRNRKHKRQHQPNTPAMQRIRAVIRHDAETRNKLETAIKFLACEYANLMNRLGSIKFHRMISGTLIRVLKMLDPQGESGRLDAVLLEELFACLRIAAAKVVFERDELSEKLEKTTLELEETKDQLGETTLDLDVARENLRIIEA